MRKMVNIDLDELERFLDFLNDKVEDVYKRETTSAIKIRIERLKNGESFSEE